jgi:hypothetical protein
MVATENVSTIRCIAITSPQLLQRCVTRRCLETVFYCYAIARLMRCLGNDGVRGLQYPVFPAARHNIFKGNLSSRRKAVAMQTPLTTNPKLPDLRSDPGRG